MDKMTEKFIKYAILYMDIAKRVAEMSHCERKKVGAIIVKDGRIISMGWNGMPSGDDNCCEDTLTKKVPYSVENHRKLTEEGWTCSWSPGYDTDDSTIRAHKTVTKDEVLHAEANALMKLAQSNDSTIGAELYLTMAPCIHCAKMIYQSGIKRVFFNEMYRGTEGVDFLSDRGVQMIYTGE